MVVAKTDTVEVPEDTRIDERAGHPWLVARQPEDLEGRFGDTQRRPTEAKPASRLEAEAAVVRRRPLEEDERLRSTGDLLQAVPDQP